MVAHGDALVERGVAAAASGTAQRGLAEQHQGQLGPGVFSELENHIQLMSPGDRHSIR